MHLPTFPRGMAAVRHVQTAFGGYDHRPACHEGGIYEMINGSAADSPLLATRPGRTLRYPSTGPPNGLFAAGAGCCLVCACCERPETLCGAFKGMLTMPDLLTGLAMGVFGRGGLACTWAAAGEETE